MKKVRFKEVRLALCDASLFFFFLVFFTSSIIVVDRKTRGFFWEEGDVLYIALNIAEALESVTTY